MRPTPNLARMPYVHAVLSSFGAPIGRSRLMRIEAASQATLHVDTNHYWAERVRIHVPIVTSPAIEFLCGDERLHMAAGESWIFDAWRPHNVMNPTAEKRIHLVADTVGSARSGIWSSAAAAARRSRSCPATRRRSSSSSRTRRS